MHYYVTLEWLPEINESVNHVLISALDTITTITHAIIFIKIRMCSVLSTLDKIKVNTARFILGQTIEGSHGSKNTLHPPPQGAHTTQFLTYKHDPHLITIMNRKYINQSGPIVM